MRSRGPVRMWASASATPQNASPYGLRWSFAPADAHIGTRRKTSTRGLESTFHNKVLIEEADISCINKSGHFHVLPTSAGRAQEPGCANVSANNRKSAPCVVKHLGLVASRHTSVESRGSSALFLSVLTTFIVSVQPNVGSSKQIGFLSLKRRSSHEVRTAEQVS